MKEDVIQLPDLQEIKEMLQTAKEEVDAEVKENPELKDSCHLIFEVIAIIDGKLKASKDLDKLNIKEKIDVAAHLSFLQGLLEDFYFFEDEEDFDMDDFEEEDEEEEE